MKYYEPKVGDLVVDRFSKDLRLNFKGIILSVHVKSQLRPNFQTWTVLTVKGEICKYFIDTSRSNLLEIHTLEQHT